jgi:hypothetical protein
VNYEAKFADAESRREKDGMSRIDDSHPADIFLGLDNGMRAFLVVCPQRPPQTPSLAAIGVDARPRHDGKWAVVLRLLRPDLKVLFNRLVEDLDGAMRQHPGNPGETVLVRLARWQHLLSKGNPELLGENQLRGLCAELDFLLSEAISAVGPTQAVAAWKGPYDAPKDFVFAHAEVEVKAVHSQPREYCISSLEQLTDAGKPLFLWVRVLDVYNIPEPDSRSVSAFVARVRAAVASDPAASEDLEIRLRLAGYEDRPEYELRAIDFSPASCFRVSQGFPRIERPVINAGVIACEYRINVAALESFKVSTWREEN